MSHFQKTSTFIIILVVLQIMGGQVLASQFFDEMSAVCHQVIRPVIGGVLAFISVMNVGRAIIQIQHGDDGKGFNNILYAVVAAVMAFVLYDLTATGIYLPSITGLPVSNFCEP